MELEPNIENGKNPRMLWQPFCMISFSRIRIILIKCIDNYPKSIHINVTINQCAIRTTLIWCSIFIKYWQVSKKKNIFTIVCFSVLFPTHKNGPLCRAPSALILIVFDVFPQIPNSFLLKNLHFYNKTKTVFHVNRPPLADYHAMSLLFVCWQIKIQILKSWVGQSTSFPPPRKTISSP